MSHDPEDEDNKTDPTDSRENNGGVKHGDDVTNSTKEELRRLFESQGDV